MPVAKQWLPVKRSTHREKYAPLRVDLAEVRWVKGWEFGLEFVRLRLEVKARLQRFISALVRKAEGGGFKHTG